MPCFCLCFYFVKGLSLFLNVFIPYRKIFGNNGFKDVVSLRHGQPFQLCNEFVDQLVDFAIIGNVALVHLDIIRSNAALSRQIFDLDIEGTLILFGF